MTSRFPGRVARVVVVTSAIIALLVLAVSAAHLLGQYRLATETLHAIGPRHARLAGLQTAGPDIVAGRAAADQGLLRIAHAADVELARIGTALQQRIRHLADEHHLRVSGSQILPPRNEQGFNVITVTATMDGEPGALATLLLALASEAPPVVVQRLTVQAPRQGRRGETSTHVIVQAHMSVIRLSP